MKKRTQASSGTTSDSRPQRSNDPRSRDGFDPDASRYTKAPGASKPVPTVEGTEHGNWSGNGTGQRIDPGLYIVSTPIGNLRDITLRALDILHAADLIACEDTRITRRLCQAYDIDAKLVPYHDHNAEKSRPSLLHALAEGKVVAQVSDAGTPVISDPGYRLVRAAMTAGHAVRAIPGASAPLAALAASGLPSDRFSFAGFPPAKSGARKTWLSDLTHVPGTLILFESANRLAATLEDMADKWGDREAAVMRELTKRFEEHRHAPLPELATHYAGLEAPPKGEIVILVGPAAEKAEFDDAAVDEMLAEALESQTVKNAAAAIAAISGRPRKQIYSRALAIAKQRQ